MNSTEYYKYKDKLMDYERIERARGQMKRLAEECKEGLVVYCCGQQIHPQLTKEERDRIRGVFTDAEARLAKFLEAL